MKQLLTVAWIAWQELPISHDPNLREFNTITVMQRTNRRLPKVVASGSLLLLITII